MRTNKQIRETSPVSIFIFGMVLSVVVAMVGFFLYNNQVDRLGDLANDVEKANNELQKLQSKCLAETGRWEELTTRSGVEAALVDHCLDMRWAEADQIVKMNEKGEPDYGIGLMRAREYAKRNAAARTAPRTAEVSSRRVANVGRVPSVRSRMTR